jgi:regulatory protein SWI5
MQRHQRQHRRQNSIPVALEAAKAPLLPAAAMQRYSIHKRGMSLNQPTANLQPNAISTASQSQYTNVLREAQQQRTSQLNQQPYFDEPHQIFSNADGQRLETRGLNVYTNQYSNENSPINACMSSGGLNIKNTNTKNRRLKPAMQPIQHQQQQQQSGQETMVFAENQLIGDGTWNPYLVNQSMLAQMYDIRRASVQSDISQQSYIPSTPPKQVQSSMLINLKAMGPANHICRLRTDHPGHNTVSQRHRVCSFYAKRTHIAYQEYSLSDPACLYAESQVTSRSPRKQLCRAQD